MLRLRALRPYSTRITAGQSQLIKWVTAKVPIKSISMNLNCTHAKMGVHRAGSLRILRRSSNARRACWSNSNDIPSLANQEARRDPGRSMTPLRAATHAAATTRATADATGAVTRAVTTAIATAIATTTRAAADDAAFTAVAAHAATTTTAVTRATADATRAATTRAAGALKVTS